MKKMTRNLFALLPVAALLMLSACGSDSDVTENAKPGSQNPTGAKQINFTVRVDNSTRASIGEDQQTLRFVSGDQLLVKGENISGLLPISSGAGSTSAEFSGTLTYTGEGDPASNLALTATLISSENVGVNTTTGEISYGSAICSTLNDAVAQYCLLTGTSTFGQATFQLTSQTAFLNFTAILPEGSTAGSSVDVTVSATGLDTREGSVTTEASGNSVVAKFVVPVAAGSSLSDITVEIGDASATLDNGVSNMLAIVYNVNKTLTTSSSSSSSIPAGVQWVQLWENGPYWADRNIGATCVAGDPGVEGYGDEGCLGDYFAWGEVVPQESCKNIWRNTDLWEDLDDPIPYSEDTYTFGWYDNNGFTKYNSTDNKTTLDSEDDAAAYNWGGNCRMPTAAEWQALLDNTTNEWTQVNGTWGRVFRGKDDYASRSIFLPDAGHCENGFIYGPEPYEAGYWSSTLSLQDSDLDYAYALIFGDYDAFVDDWTAYRNHGLPVRAVRDNL